MSYARLQQLGQLESAEALEEGSSQVHKLRQSHEVVWAEERRQRVQV